MAYSGTTSTAPNVPAVVSQAVRGPRSWVYVSTHISSDIEAANFFTDGKNLGMKPGDWLTHVSVSSYPLSSTAPSSGITTLHQIVLVGSTTTDLSVGTTVGAGA